MRELGFIVLLLAAACGNKGTETVYSPQSQGPEPAKLVSSAVELKTEADRDKLIASGAVLLGRVSIKAESVRDDFSQSHGGSQLAGRASIEAASRGGTHFYLEGSDQQRATTYWQSDVALARFAVYRVEKDQWPKLDPQYQPSR